MTHSVGARTPWLHLLAPVFCVLCTAVAFPVRAQDAAGEPAEAAAPSAEGSSTPTAGIEEIVVRAEIPSAVANDAPISAVAFDAETLKREGITDIRDLSNFTPNLEIKTAFAATNPTLFIRGVGLDDFNANSASSVAVYQDRIYMNSPAGQLFQMFDVQSVDVLRGPQGTLRNASAGAILVTSNKPTDEFEAATTATYGNYNKREVEAMVNVPLIPEFLSARAAFKFNQRDGKTKNRCNHRVKRGDTVNDVDPCSQATERNGIFGREARPLTRSVNDIDNWALRGMLRLTVPLPEQQELELLLNVNGGQNKSGATQYQHRAFQKQQSNDDTPNDGNFYLERRSPRGDPGSPGFQVGEDQSGYKDKDQDEFAGDYNRQGDERLDLFGASLLATWQVSDSLTVESISGYAQHDRETQENTDANPFNFYHVDYISDSWQFSEEANLIYQWGEQSETKFGADFLIEELDSNDIQFELTRTNSPNFDKVFHQKTQLFSFYSDSTLEIPPIFSGGLGEFFGRFTVEGGARYSFAYKEFDIRVDGRSTEGDLTSVPPTTEDEMWDHFTGEVSLNYQITEDVGVYGKYSHGWKPGHFNGGTLFSTETVESIKPETVDAFEVGLRSSWFDGRLGLNLTGFMYDYENLQVFRLITDARGFVLPKLVNAQQATIKGFEVELNATPIEGLEINYSAGYLDTEYDEFTTFLEIARPPQSGGGVIQSVQDYSGNPLLAAPEWAMNGSIDYTIPLPFDFGTLRPRFSFTFKDHIFFDPNEGRGGAGNVPKRTFSERKYWLYNAGLIYQSPDQRFEFSGWVRNITNKAYRIQSFDLSSSRRAGLDVYGDPRTYGVTLSLRY